MTKLDEYKARARDLLRAFDPRYETDDEFIDAESTLASNIATEMLKVQQETVDAIAEPFEVEQHCTECGTPMRPPVSLWRCEHEPKHTAAGPEIGFEIRSRTT